MHALLESAEQEVTFSAISAVVSLSGMSLFNFATYLLASTDAAEDESTHLRLKAAQNHFSNLLTLIHGSFACRTFCTLDRSRCVLACSYCAHLCEGYKFD